jgi:hypothetical protein
MNNGINAANIGVAARRQQPSEPRGPSRGADGYSTPRGDRRSTTVSWYGTLLIVSVLAMGAAWEIFKWIVAIITLD